MLDDLAFRECVQGLVAHGPTPGSKIRQDGGDDALGEPAHRCAGALGAGQGVVEGLQFADGAAGLAPVAATASGKADHEVSASSATQVTVPATSLPGM